MFVTNKRCNYRKQVMRIQQVAILIGELISIFELAALQIHFGTIKMCVR